MTKTDWTAEEVRERAMRSHMSDRTRGMLIDLSNRIEADERAVPFAWYLLTGHGNGLEFGERAPVEGMGWRPLFTRPPAQPAQVDKCCCGEPSVSGVRHRSDGPCHLSDADGTPAQEQPGRKVPDERKAPMYSDESRQEQYEAAIYDKGWNACRAAMLAASPTPPKEK